MTLVFFIGGLGLLYVGGEILVSSAAALGKRLHLSPLVAGLTIVAFATSAPELAISISAATNDLPGLAIGNVIGSNICNIALILGIVTILKPAPVRQTLVRRDVLVMALTTLLVPGLLLDGSLARVEGALLVTCIVVYIVLTLWHARATRSQRTPDENVVPTLTENVGLNAVLAVVGLVILVTGSRLFVEASVAIAMIIGVPAAVVGLSANGASDSQVTFHLLDAAGNLIGSNIFNLLLILGATSLLQPLTMRSVTLIDLGAMIAITGLALSLMLTRARLERTEGFVLVAAYCIYMVWIYVQPAAN